MPRTVTVTFEDGTRHVYQNVPDSATPDSVTQRAQQEFGKGIVNIDGGRTPEPASVAQQFGRSAASLADVGINAVTGTLDMLAYPLARAYYGMNMPADQAAARAKAETTSPKDVIGRTFNVAQTPEYQGEAARRVTGAIGENVVAPVVKAGAQYTGAPEPDVESVLGIGSMAVAPGAARAARPVVTGAANLAENTVAAIPAVAKATAQAPVDVARGFGGAITGQIAKPGRQPTALQTPSSRVPLGETYIDPLEWARYQAGEIPIQQVQPRPIQQLPESMMFGRPALALAGNEMPVAGQGARAFGEALGRQYRSSPITGALDIGAASIGLPPPVATYRGAQALADLYLSGRGFDPNLPREYSAAVRQADMGPPRPPMAPTGPVAPAPVPTSNQMMLPLSNQIAPAPEQFNLTTTPGFVPPQPTASMQSQVQQAAAARVVGMPEAAGPVKPSLTPEQRAIIEQIRARGQQPKPLDFDEMARNREADLALQARKAAGESYQPPKSAEQRLQEMTEAMRLQQTQPEQPVAPTYTPKEEQMFQSQMKTAPKGYGRGETVSEIEVLSAERKARESGLRSDELVAKQLRQRLEDQTRQGIAPSAAPKGTIGMIVPERNALGLTDVKRFDSKTAAEKEMTMAILANKEFRGSYPEGNSIITIDMRKNPFADDPRSPLAGEPYTTTTFRENVATGRVEVKMGDEWFETEAMKPDLAEQLKSKLKK
jgi:hypothetical protein